MNVKSAEPLPAKKHYASPKLVKYGEVRSLTQTGTMSGMENKPNQFTPSDRNLKENVVEVGLHPWGMRMYLFEYKAEYRERYGRGRHLGVMADEVEAILPDAVCVGPSGHKMVDYRRLAILIPDR